MSQTTARGVSGPDHLQGGLRARLFAADAGPNGRGAEARRNARVMHKCTQNVRIGSGSAGRRHRRKVGTNNEGSAIEPSVRAALGRVEPLDGLVTATIDGPRGAREKPGLCCCNGILPLRRRFGSEGPQRGPGDEVALKIEGVVTAACILRK